MVGSIAVGYGFDNRGLYAGAIWLIRASFIPNTLCEGKTCEMNISVTWENPEQTIVLMRLVAVPDAIDVDEAFSSAFGLVQTVKRKTAILFDVTTDPLPPPPHIINRSRSHFENPPENLVAFVIVGPGAFGGALMKVLALVGGMNYIYTAETHEAAYEIVEPLLLD